MGCGTRPAGMALQRLRTVQGWVVDAADGPQPPLVASLLPLAVWAGALAFAGFAGSRGWDHRCGTRTTRRREGVAASGLANGNAPRRGASPNLGRRVALQEVGVMPWGRGAERRPSWASQWRFVLAARHGWRAVLRVLGPPSARSGGRAAPRWSWGRTVALEGMRFPAPRFPCGQSATACTTLAATAARTMDRDRRDDLIWRSGCRGGVGCRRPEGAFGSAGWGPGLSGRRERAQLVGGDRRADIRGLGTS